MNKGTMKKWYSLEFGVIIIMLVGYVNYLSTKVLSYNIFQNNKWILPIEVVLGILIIMAGFWLEKKDRVSLKELLKDKTFKILFVICGVLFIGKIMFDFI